jgi:hypothetical protein
MNLNYKEIADNYRDIGARSYIVDLPNDKKEDKRKQYCDKSVSNDKFEFPPAQFCTGWLKKSEENESNNEFDEETYYKCISYESNTGYKLTAISCLDGGLLILETPKDFCPKDFCIVACDGHPYVETSYISYCNSDGSGPDMFNDEQMKDPDFLLARMKVRYREFLANRYH